MMIVRRLSFVSLLLASLAVFGQSADQEVVSAVDSPDPVTPGATLSYAVTLTNHGPDPATNGGININLPGALTHTTDVAPAGFTCSWFGNSGTCNTPSLAVGTYAFTINATVGSSLASFPDQTITAQFFPSGTTPDPNSGNNMKTADTLVDSPQVDLSLTATDSPDPVFPDGTITYTVNVTNSGPDTASSVNFNVVPQFNLAFQSVTVPAGWSCVPPSVGALNATFSCSRATWAPGTSQFIVAFSANDENIGILDTSLNSYFGVFANASDETDDGQDNDETVTTQYVTPDADVYVSVSDSPDPVFPDGNITYTVIVGNSGPDTAPSITLSSFGNNNLRFQSATVPAGWNCSLPAAGAQTAGFSCTLPGGMVNAGSSVLTFVLQATDELIGINDATIQFGFSANSTVSDPDPSDNSETENTAYVTPDADLNITATDSPDPVIPDGDITYTITMTNQGPDAAPNATMAVAGNGGQTRFVSLTAPAGWTCNPPAPGTLLNVSGFQCTNPSFASAAVATFTVVTEAGDDLHPNTDHNITQAFTASSSVTDPDGTDNSVTVTTAYNVPNADISVTNTDSPDPVAQGATITYTQSITNNGPEAAANVTFIQSTPAGTTFQSFVAPVGWTCATPSVGGTGAISCSRPAMNSLETGAFTLVVTVTGTGTISSTVTGSSDASDAVPGDNSATALTTVIATLTADLSVTKTTATTSAPAGSTINYTITLTNNGPAAAVNPVLTDALPASLLFRSITTPAGFTCTTPAFRATGTITCTAATLANGANATFTLVVEVAGNATGTIVNSAGATSDTNDGNSANSTGSASPVTAAAATAVLSVSKTTVTTSTTNGSIVDYTITVSNAGPSTATNVVVTDTLPASLQFISATPTQGTCNAASPVVCNLGTILASENATITLSTRVVAASGTITNTASATATESAAASATTPPLPVTSAAEVPTLSEWMLLLMAAMLAIAAVVKTRWT